MLRSATLAALAGVSLLAPALPASARTFPDLPAVAAAQVCGAPAAGRARCHAEVVVDRAGRPGATTSPSSTAFTPARLQGAYHLPSAVAGAGAGQTVAIVDAYDNPNAEADLASYRSAYGLGDCTSGNGCFRKLDQRGRDISAGGAPAGNTGWGQEIALDLDMASAICPQCRILLVEADDAGLGNLGAAVDTAVRNGATVVSNSYGAREFSGEAGYAGSYDHPGVAITVSSGDGGYGVEFPAAAGTVTAVGGTSLQYDATTGARSEKAWSGAGSGCSAYLPRPSWQRPVGTCTRRMVSDVSAVADPATGVTVYDSYGSSGGANWYVFGGTSVASPIVASVFALAGNAASIGPSYPYGRPGALFDVVSGSNGRCTTGRTTANAPLCTAGPGWDGPTGLGTPNGTSAF